MLASASSALPMRTSEKELLPCLDSHGAVGWMGDLQRPYIFKKSLASFCAAAWSSVKNEALVSPLLPPLLA